MSFEPDYSQPEAQNLLRSRLDQAVGAIMSAGGLRLKPRENHVRQAADTYFHRVVSAAGRAPSVPVVAAIDRPSAAAAHPASPYTPNGGFQMANTPTTEFGQRLLNRSPSEAIYSLKAAGLLASGLDDWAREQFRINKEAFVAAHDWRPELVAATAHARGQTLRELGLSPLTADETRLVSGSGGLTARRQLINKYRADFARDRDARSLGTSELTYVSGSLIAAGHTRISEHEARELALVG